MLQWDYAKESYFGWAHDFGKNERPDQLILLLTHPEHVNTFMERICDRFQRLTRGFRKWGQRIIGVTLYSVRIFHQPGDHNSCLKVLHESGGYELDVNSVLLRCNEEWTFLEKLHHHDCKKTFVLGTHSRMGAQSSVRRATQHDLYERQVLGLVFQFYAP